MSLDLDAILLSFIETAQNTVGSQLSTVGSTSSPEPAVIKVRQDAPKPDYPYITVDVLNITDSGNWLLDSYVKDTGDLVYTTLKDLLIQYRVYGGNAVQIANDLHGYFRVDTILSKIKTDTGGLVTTVGDVSSLPNLRQDTEFVEVASININFSIEDTLIIPDDGTNWFDKVHLDGEVYPDGSSSPLSTTVDAP